MTQIFLALVTLHQLTFSVSTDSKLYSIAHQQITKKLIRGFLKYNFHD
mgnify:CR=1